ncbi:MAG: hypothetical protein E7812_06155 [Phenylobacterium sp.]|nr:MAG: hypothetical protein E7812_06155 [Phenylobacterium sp.]
MLRGIARIVSHRTAGWAFAAATVGLAVALAVTTAETRRDEQLLRNRIAALATHDASQLQAQLGSCHASNRAYAAALSAAAPRAGDTPHTMRVKAVGGDATAASLVSNPPAGFDVCARMESADQAVLKTLDRR